jgi:hypothetical protein
LSAARRSSPNSQERSKILWMGKCRLKTKFRQLCACPEYVAAAATR